MEKDMTCLFNLQAFVFAQRYHQFLSTIKKRIGAKKAVCPNTNNVYNKPTRALSFVNSSRVDH